MKKNKTGFVVAFEGIDGCGKTTLIQACERYLQEKYTDIVVTRQPGGSSLGTILYNTVLDQSQKMVPVAEFLLFAADRAQHMHDIIIPAKNRGALVLCDRMGDSSLVYQGYAKGVDLSFIRQVHAYIIGSYTPDLTFFCHISVQDALIRRNQRKNNDQFDAHDITFFDAVCAGYSKVYAESQDNVIVLDALLPIDRLVDTVIQAIQKRFTI